VIDEGGEGGDVVKAVKAAKAVKAVKGTGHREMTLFTIRHPSPVTLLQGEAMGANSGGMRNWEACSKA
jgi:hypothetical protein